MPEAAAVQPKVQVSKSTGKKRALLLDNLFATEGTSGGAGAGGGGTGSGRPLFYKTPENQHLDLGKDKNELEMLLEKFQPEFEQMVPALCDALNAVIVAHTLASRRKSVVAGRDKAQQRFADYETSAVPEISLEDYLWRIVDYCYISPTSLVLACILIDKLIQDHGLMLSQLNIFKLFFTSVRVASKVHELRSLSNKNFAVVGGVTAAQLNALESTFVGVFNWELWVSHETFRTYCTRLRPESSPPDLPIVGM